jgi:hypothetical protein
MLPRLESWHDILRASTLHVNVVCAQGNWETRLAAAAVCRALGYKTYIVPQRVCWLCVELAGGERGEEGCVGLVLVMLKRKEEKRNACYLVVSQ